MNKIRQFVSQKGPYFWATLLFVAWLVYFPIRSFDCVIGKIDAHLLGKVGLGGTYHLSSGSFLLIFYVAELKMFFGPGFFAGLIVGYFKVTKIGGIFKGLIPPAILLVPVIPALFSREGFLIVDMGIRYFFLFGGIYSLAGASVGWILGRYRKLQ